jgi:hypothetical protein
MKKLLNFNQFVNESKLNEKALNASQASREDLYTAEQYIQEKMQDGDDDIANTTKKICDLLGELPTKVFAIDQYTEDTDDLIDTYERISSKFRGTQLSNFGEKDDVIRHDEKMGIVEMGNTFDDFIIFWFTEKSKF